MRWIGAGDFEGLLILGDFDMCMVRDSDDCVCLESEFVI